ncbi:MAG: NADH-quinone oxidoreductase subunit J [Chitinophagaceae bacterium]|nr:NADH-quinone oxidoreductase subunit J [Chitinophagaceae bacterium]
MNNHTILFFSVLIEIALSLIFILCIRDIVSLIYALLLTLIGVAVLYFLCGYSFIGMVQLIIYVGGILVFMILGVLLDKDSTPSSFFIKPSLLLQKLFFLLLFSSIFLYFFDTIKLPTAPLSFQEKSLQTLGMDMVTKHSILFEIMGLLLFITVVGSTVIITLHDKKK